MKLSVGVGTALVLCCCMTNVVVSKPIIRGLWKKSDIPSEGWVTLDNGVEFHANDNDKDDPQVQEAVHRMLKDKNNGVYSKQFLDGAETYYDEYAQAWRLLGFYIDCNSFEEIDEYADYNDYNNNGGYRDLEDYGDAAYNGAVCTRYLLWAGYIDPKYEGGGIAEYQQFNKTTKSWDASNCDENLRCAKMDCHEAGTNYKLLGIFKEANLNNWFNQLVQHQGSCVWQEKTHYALSTKYQSAFPLECTQSNTYDKDGNYIYYHSKPLDGGRITIGLYTESSCRKDYKGQLSAADVLSAVYVQREGNDDAVEEQAADNDDGYAAAGDDGNAAAADDDDDWYKSYWANAAKNRNNNDDGYGNRVRRNLDADATYSLYKSIDSWNSAFDVFKICKPCKAWHEGEVCTDSSGAYGANQCMLFSSNTKMNTATFKDAALASEQGTIVSFIMDGTKFGHGGYSTGPSWILITAFCASVLVCGGGIYMYCKARRAASAAMSGGTMKQPLVESDGVML